MTPLTILTAIFNTLWQGAALAGLVWLGLRWIRVNAATRCVIWWAVLVTLCLLPAMPRFIAARHVPQVISARGQIAPDSYSPPPDVDEAPAIVMLPERSAAKWPLAIFALWAAVLLYRLARIGQSYLHLRRVKRNSILSDLRLADVGRRACLLISRDIASPMAVGFLRPAVILPEDLADRITPGELDQILLHEAAHLARRDDWWNLLGRVLGAALALHPVAWWILRQIEYEREAACDDWVVARTGAVRPYAESLARMVELRWQGSNSRGTEALASGVFGHGSRIGDRIEMLLRHGREFSPRVSARRVVAGSFMLCCLVAAGSFAPRWVAFAKTPVMPVALPKNPEPQPGLVAQAVPPTPAPRTIAPKVPPVLRFEVASIRPAIFPSAAYEAGFYAHGAAGNPCFVNPSISGTRVSLPRASICDLIAFAYGLQGYQIVGTPTLPKASGMQESMSLVDATPSFFYDVEARAPGSDAPTKDDARAMLRTLLAERFNLKAHHETRNLSYSALVVGKHGTKLVPSREDCQPHGGGGRGDKVHVCNRSTEQLARSLNGLTERPVVDATGLTGTFDYDIQPFNADNAASAYEEQLGLSLESRKGPVDVLVVDHVEPPSGN